MAHAGLYRPTIRVSESACRVRLLLSLHLPACEPAAAAAVEELAYVGLVAAEPGYAGPVVEEPAYVAPVAEEPAHAEPVVVAF
jgi:hypothetical protein